MVYDHHFSHSIIHITAISSFAPSSAACPVGVQFIQVYTADERRQCSIIVYGDLLLNALLVERASKQYDHAHTFHRSTSSVGLAGVDGEFPVTRAATEFMHGCVGKKSLQSPLLCGFFHFFVHPSGHWLAAPRWVKASYRWRVYDFGFVHGCESRIDPK